MRLLFLLLFLSQFTFSQSKKQSLEDKIYGAVDAFVASPNGKSLQKLEQVEATFHPKSKPELLAFVILKCNKAYYQNQFGYTTKAISNYEKAWQIYQKNALSNYDIIESCLQPLGNLYTIIGDYDNAENTIKQYFYSANVKKNQSQKHAAILNLSAVYQNTGRITEAIKLLDKTIKTEKLTSSQKGNIWNNIGTNYFLNDQRDSAKAAFQKAIQYFDSEIPDSEKKSNAYRNLAKIYAHEHDFNQATTCLEQSRELFFMISNKTPRQVAQLYYDMALLDFQKGDLALAQVNIKATFDMLLPNYSKSKTILPARNILYTETVLLDALDLQAELFLVQNQSKKAVESLALSFHVEALIEALLVYENSKIVSQIRNRNRTEKCLDIYYSLYRKEKKNNYIEQAFLLAEQSKSTVLKKELSRSKARSREEKLIIEQLQDWNTIILKEQQKLDDADISKINVAIKKQNELMLLLKSKTSKTSNESKHQLSISQLFTKLEKDNAVMVEYFVGKEHLYAFTLENQAIKWKRIEEKFNEDSVFRTYLSYFNEANAIANQPKEFNHFAHMVYQLLHLPKPNSNKNLIIIPDGILHFLPFDALITQRSLSTNFAKMHYLLYDFSIGYHNSADFYLNTIPFQHQKETVLGVFPVFEKTKFELVFSKQELADIQSNFDGKFLENQKATFQNFKANALPFSILHLSTHASSGDIVEPASIKFYNQDVLYSELYHLNLNPDLVVLSACETGIGKWYKAEGAMSIARGFQFAGAQNLVYSLWKVNDFTTSVFMQKLYKNIKSGNSYFESTHQAKIDFLQDEALSNAKKSPYYWSAFVYYGTLENKSTSHTVLWIGLFAGVIILFLLWLQYKAKSNRKR